MIILFWVLFVLLVVLIGLAMYYLLLPNAYFDSTDADNENGF